MSSGDPYEILGVKRDATKAEIQKAYRRLAKKLHPDLNPGDKEAERKFKALASANDLLSDPEKRARFDRGEIDASGAEQPQRRYYRDFADAGGAGGPHPYESSAGFSDFGGMDDVLSDLFGQRGARFRGRGQDLHFILQVDFLDAVNGATRQIQLPDGAKLDVTIPPGVNDGQMLRLRGKGGPGGGGGGGGGGEQAPPGDALIELSVKPHPLYRRDGDDIRLELPISLSEAVLGGKIKVPTPAGPVMATLAKWSDSGKVLRLKGRGVRRRDDSRGDLYVTLRIVLPPEPDAALEEFVAGWTAGKAQDPRKGVAS